jgi:hypothetical protein
LLRGVGRGILKNLDRKFAEFFEGRGGRHFESNQKYSD